MRRNFPHLFSFVINPQASVHQVVNEVYIEDLFHLPLTTQAHEEFISMENLCLEIRQSNYFTMTDTWSYIWGNGVFSSSKAYSVLIGHKQVPRHFKWIWKSSCQPKRKVFFWMLLHDRVNTRNLLRRKTFALDDYNCSVLNCQQEETLHHLF